MEKQVYEVRAIPAPGHDRRWGAQRPFTRTPTDVTVCDNPKPHEREGGDEVGKIIAYSYEMTPSDLEEINRDPQLVVIPKGEIGTDVLELNAAKARIQELEAKAREAAKAHQAELEELKAFRAGSLKQAEEAGAQRAQIEQQLATANAQLVERGKKK